MKLYNILVSGKLHASALVQVEAEDEQNAADLARIVACDLPFEEWQLGRQMDEADFEVEDVAEAD